MGQTDVSWMLYFNPESPIINNSTDQDKIRATIPPIMTLEAGCVVSDPENQIDNGIMCTAFPGNNTYELTVPFETNDFTQTH